MRLPFIFLLFFSICCGNHYAQAQHTLSGIVTDKGGSRLSFATIIVQQLPDSNILMTTIADSNGNYRVDARKLHRGFVTAGAAGYLPKTQSLTDTTAKSQELNFGLEANGIELKEFAVSSKKPLIERKVDRVVFNVENSISALGGDALEAVGKAPGVRVSGADDISLAGKNSVSVMINDRLIQVGGEELAEMLRAIPSENIMRIEVITTPPAKYDAAGNSGIINIVTKKSNRKGLNGSVGSNYTQNSLSSFREVAALNYRNDKLNVYANTDIGDNFSRPVETHNAYYTNQQWQQVSKIDNLHNFHYSQLGIDYNITPKSIIGVLYTFEGSTPKRNEDITGKWLNVGNEIDSIVHTLARTNEFGERHVVNVNYEWKIDTAGKKLNMDCDYFTRTGRTVRNFSTIDMLGDGTPTGVSSVDKSTGRQVLYIGSLKADMELPTTFAKVSFGGKASFLHVISDNVFEYMDNGAYVVDRGKTNKFDYSENTQALYLSAQKKLNKQWDAQAGLRAEYTQTRAVSLTLASARETQYLQLFPTAYLQYTRNEDNVYNLNYSRRIDRPNMMMINPFRRYMTPNSYDEGNPFLQPSFSSNVELSYTLKSSYTFAAYVQHTQQVSTQILEIDSVNKGYYFRYANIGTSLNYGISASASFTITKWWETDIQAYGYHARVAANYYNAVQTNEYELTACTMENEHTFTLNKNKTLMAELGFEYTSAMIESYNYHNPNANVYCGFRALLFKRSLTIGFNASDLFRTQTIKVRNLYNSSVTNNYYDSRGFRVNVSWKFGNQNIKSKRERNTTLEESRRS